MPSQVSTNALRLIFVVLAAFLAPLSAQGPSGLSLARPNHLRGTVVNSVTHEPVPYALVLSPDNLYATMADDRGHFEFTLMPTETPSQQPLVNEAFSGSPGLSVGAAQISPAPNRPSTLIARKPGFLEINDGTQQIYVASDQQDVTIPLTPEARVIGRVNISGSDSPDKIEVSLYRRDVQEGRERWNGAGTVRTRSRGEFRFANLAPGTYKLLTLEHMDRDPLTFDPRGQLFGYPPVYFPAASDFESAATIRLSAGENFQAILAPSRREYYPVKLALTNAPPALRPQVEVWPQGHPGPGYSLGYDNRQDAIVGTLPNGSYTVLLRTYGPSSMTGMTGITNFSVSGAPTVGTSIALTPGIAVPVTVKEELQNKPKDFNGSFSNGATGETFAISPQRPSYLNMVLAPVSQFGTAADVGLGNPAGPEDTSLLFEGVAPGRYHVQAQTSLGYISSMLSGNTDLLRKPLVVAPGAAPEAIEVTVRDDGADIDGTIAGAEQASALPTAASPVMSYSRWMGTGHLTQQPPVVYFIPSSDAGGQFRMAWIAPDGKFRIAQVPPGSYRVLAFERQQPELEHATKEELRRYDSKAQVIEVAAGDKKSLRLDLIPASE